MNYSPRIVSPLMTTTETAATLGISKARLAAMRHTGTGPKYYRLGHRIIRYNRASIDHWVRARDADTACPR
jgi:predicted DNA-binding transcriptional regulator AlpA